MKLRNRIILCGFINIYVMKNYVMGFELFCESLKQGKEYLKQGKIEQSVLDEIVTIDPTKNNKYVGWLCKQFISEPFDI
jgi:hypothetical protein